MEEKRLLNFDILRVFAAYMIVVLHLSSNYVDVDFISSLVRMGVPLFIMISGAFLLDPGKNVSGHELFAIYIPKVIGIFLVWSAFYALVTQDIFAKISELGFAKGCESIDWSVFGKSWILGHYHMWYFYMLVGLYLIVPFLRAIVKAGKQELLTYFLVLCLIITSVTKLNQEIWQNEILSGVLDKLGLTFVFGYVGYFVAGYYFNHYQFTTKRAKFIYVMGILAYIMTANSGVFFPTPQEATQITDYVVSYTPVFFSNFSPTVFVMTFAMFLFFARLRDKNFGKLFNAVGYFMPKYMLVVYLVHPFVIGFLTVNNLLMMSVGYRSLIINSIIVFLVSLIISMIIRRFCQLMKKLRKN